MGVCVRVGKGSPRLVHQQEGECHIGARIGHET